MASAEYMKKWREDNLELIRAQHREYYYKNRELIKSRQLSYYHKNKGGNENYISKKIDDIHYVKLNDLLDKIKKQHLFITMIDCFKIVDLFIIFYYGSRKYELMDIENQFYLMYIDLTKIKDKKDLVV